jgi:N-acetylmuramoyl-L-alanine amidase
LKKYRLRRCALGYRIFIILIAALTLPLAVRHTAGQPDASGGNDLQLLARCVNGEARGEDYIGQVAVAAVILNRVKHPAFPNSVSGVIYQPGAFTAVSDGQINLPVASDSQVYNACRDAMNGYDPSGGAIYYYNPAKTTNQWIYSREVITTIGKHKFAV